jgi:antitoxin component of MazEF toxin-antitoxin module
MRTTYASRYCKNGGSEAVIIPRDIRKQLQLTPGDMMLMVRYGPLLIMRKATPGLVFDRDALPAEAIPGPHFVSSSNV